ncbi:MAG: YbfB/YjiJ family MFS transporter, partial [Tateyamaria sp.]|nr:YbfB/YjiJ family MFS transporter [Tateyamaria sp.]
ESWGRQMSLFTVIFAATQTVGPYAAGWIGDYFDNIGVSLLFASIILLLGAAFAFFQKPILR